MNFFSSMPFNFSFTISIPGLTNPFSALAHAKTTADLKYQSEAKRSQPQRHLGDVFPSQLPREHTNISSKMADSWTVVGSAPSRLPTPTISPSASSLFLPLNKSRKRGWIPASAEPSQAIVYTSSTSGFLDTPSKYRDMAGDDQDQSHEEVVVGKCYLIYSVQCNIRSYIILNLQSFLRLPLFASNSSCPFAPFHLSTSVGQSSIIGHFTPFSHGCPAQKLQIVRSIISRRTKSLTMSDPDLPPAKRRKGIAGSVISTAFSAALIGAAVGLTVYRL
jgi:hypothetical protein